MKKILPLCLLLAACQTTAQQPTVEDVNRAQAAREASCQKQGYRQGTRDYYTCLQLAEAQATQDAINRNQGLNQGAQTAAIGAGAALTGLSLLAVFSDERLKRDIVPIGTENGYHVYRFHYLWSDQQYIGVIAQEIEQQKPDAVILDPSGYLKVNYTKIGVAFRRAN